MKLFYWTDKEKEWSDYIIETDAALNIDVEVMLNGFWNHENSTYLEAY